MRIQGEKHHPAKLTQAKVNEIRAMYLDGAGSQREIAKQFGISQTTVSMIINRITWRPHEETMTKTLTPACQVCDGLRDLIQTPAGHYCKEHRPMTKTQKVGHTPGPWATGKFSNGEWFIKRADDTVSFATVKGFQRAEANARLIAAAPTMYAYIEQKANEGDVKAKEIIANACH